MDILEILKNNYDNLLEEDLTFFETELETGEGYTEDYKRDCKNIIVQIRIDKKKITRLPEQRSSEFDEPLFGFWGVSESEFNKVKANELMSAIQQMRKQANYRVAFKTMVANNSVLDEAFVEKNIGQFEKWELAIIITEKPFSEDFLEKYFSALDPDKIARYQVFSESFFMNHYQDLNVNTVLKFGKNPWRQKDKRSKQLDVFLRLKGVKL